MAKKPKAKKYKEDIHQTEIVNKIAKEAVLGYEKTTVPGKEAAAMFERIKKDIAGWPKDTIVDFAKE